MWKNDSQIDEFSAKLLALVLNEGSAVFDVNRDGVLDIVAGRIWYTVPEYRPRPVRTIEDMSGHVHSNGDFAYDVDGDGNLDFVVAGKSGTYAIFNEGSR